MRTKSCKTYLSNGCNIVVVGNSGDAVHKALPLTNVRRKNRWGCV